MQNLYVYVGYVCNVQQIKHFVCRAWFIKDFEGKMKQKELLFDTKIAPAKRLDQANKLITNEFSLSHPSPYQD